MLSWLYLYAAIVLEVAGTTSLKASDGFRNLWAGSAALAFYTVSLVLLSLALRTVPVSIAYAIWSGIGIVCITVIGFAWFGEQVGALKLLFIALILIGAVGLNLLSAAR